MSRRHYTPEQRKAISERVKARFAAMSPEERAAYAAKFRPKDPSANAHRTLVKFWAGCTGEARAKRCAHLTNPEAQAKSHEAQRTPEFLKRRSEWAKRMWAKYTPEERLAVGARLRAIREQQRIDRGLPPVAPKKPKLSPEERLAVQRANMAAADQRSYDGVSKPILASPVKGPGRPMRFPSAAEAAKHLVKIGRCKGETAARVFICNVLHGRRKSAYGRRWRFDQPVSS